MGKLVKKFRDLSVEELSARLTETRTKLFDLRIKNERRQLENPMEIRSMCKDVARILTLIKEKG